MATATKAVQAGGTIQMEQLAVEGLRESPLNTRKHFDKKKLEELTESVREKGVLTPLLVRPGAKSHTWEILAGARRYRAAQAAGLGFVPCVIRDVDDTTALEIITIENLQREDVHPLEEAEGYQALLAKGKYDIAALAAKVGKSESYVYQRLKLAELVPAAKKAFLEEKITAGHAILIARLQPKDQQRLLKDGLQNWNSGGTQVASVRDVTTWIHRNVHLDLHSAPFKKADAGLLPAAGACTTCPKRTGFAKALFPDIEQDDTCTDPQCFNAKLDAFVQVQLKQNAKALRVSDDYRTKTKDGPLGRDRYEQIGRFGNGERKCAHAQPAIMVDGRARGTLVSICVNAKCKTHGRGIDSASRTTTLTAEEEAARQRRQTRRERAIGDARNEAVRQIAAHTPSLASVELLEVASAFFARLTCEGRKLACKILHVWPKDGKTGGFDFSERGQKYIGQADAHGLARALLVFAMVPEYGKWSGGFYSDKRTNERLARMAAAAGVNVAALEKSFLQAAKPKAKVQTSAKAQRGVCRICGCTESTPCIGGIEGACAWVDKTKTLCTNPACLKKAQRGKAA